MKQHVSFQGLSAFELVQYHRLQRGAQPIAHWSVVPERLSGPMLRHVWKMDEGASGSIYRK